MYFERSKGALKDLGAAHGLVMEPDELIEGGAGHAENQGNSMAIERATKESAEDFKAHEHDYLEFTRLFKFGAIGAFAVAMIVLLIL